MLNFKKCERHFAPKTNHFTWYEDKRAEVYDKLNNLIDFFQLLSYTVWNRKEHNDIYIEFNEDYFSENSIVDFKELTYYLTYLESDVIFEDDNQVIFKFENEGFEVLIDKPTEFFYFTV